MNKQLPEGLQLAHDACSILTQPNASNARDAICDEHAQRVTLQRHAADQAQRIADLETKCDTLKRLHDAAADERDALRARLAEIEAQEPVAWMRESDAEWLAVRGYMTVSGECDGGWRSPLYARPVTAQGGSDGWRLAAWAHEDGRVIRAETMEIAKRDGGATYSSVKAYTIPLYAAQGMSTMHKHDAAPLLVQQIMDAIVGCEASDDELREMIAAALADARREGADQMQSAAFDACVMQANADRRFAKSDRNAGAVDCATELAELIRTLPLPTGERQAVLLTDEQIDALRLQTGYAAGMERFSIIAHDIEGVVLAANNLEVRRG